MLSFFQRDVLDEILDLIESVSEGFPTYSWKNIKVLSLSFYVMDSGSFYAMGNALSCELSYL